jgi:cystathionine beta-lyase
MTTYDFDHSPDRRSTNCAKWGIYKDDVIPAWIADMDFASPEPIVRALRERIEHGVFGYPDWIPGMPDSLLEFRQLIVERMVQRYGWRIRPEDIVFVPGVVIGFNMACHALASTRKAVAIQTPVYPPILHAADYTGILRQESEMVRAEDGAYAFDWEAFEASLTPQARLSILCNPHNPTGRVFTRDELHRLAEICLRHGVTIVSDEIHSDLVYQGNHHIPIASLDPEIAENTITLIAPSKTFNTPGLQCSLAIIQNRDLRKRYLKGGKGLVTWVNMMGVYGAYAAYRDCQDWLEQLLVYLQANRDFLFEYVQRELPGVRMGLPQGTYLAWLDCRQSGIDGNPYRFFLEQSRVALNDGETFGQGGQGFVRLNFGCPRSTLVEVLERMKAALAAL